MTMLFVELVNTCLSGPIASCRREAVIHVSFCIPESIFILQLENKKKAMFS